MSRRREYVWVVRGRTASERMNSRAERLLGKNTLRGLARVGGYVGLGFTLMILVAPTSYRQRRLEFARSIDSKQAM